MREIEGLCRRCGENEATVLWLGSSGALAYVHGGGEPWCERCCVEEQVIHARGRAAELEELEAKLAELGGPAPATCECIPALLTLQECPVHGEVDYGLRYVDENFRIGAASRYELWKEIGREGEPPEPEGEPHGDDN